MERIMISYTEESGVEVQVQRLQITLPNGRSIWSLQAVGYSDIERVTDVLNDAALQADGDWETAGVLFAARAVYDSL